jgi:hypothetical protein
MTDWYIDQMKTKTYESNPLFLLHDQYVGDKLDYVSYSKIESRWDIKDLMSFIKTLNQRFKCKMDKLFISILPTR